MLHSVLLLVMIMVVTGEDVVLDLSHDIGPDTMFWPGGSPYTRTEIVRGYQEEGFWRESYDVCMAEHSSTHLDAPSHFAENKWTVDQIPLTHLLAPGVVVDIQEKVKVNPLAELSTEDLTAWLETHGPLPDKVVVLVRTGWANRYGNATAYFGQATTNPSDPNLVFPGISVEAARFLTRYHETEGRRVVGVGLDTPSLDYGASTTFPTHVELFTHNVYGIENLKDMSALPAKGFHMTVMPIKLKGGSGGAARILATIPDNNSNNNNNPSSAPIQDSTHSSAYNSPPLSFLFLAFLGVVLRV